MAGVVGCLIPLAFQSDATASLAVPLVPGFELAWRESVAAIGAVDVADRPPFIVVSGPGTRLHVRGRDDGKVVWAAEHRADVPPATSADSIFIATGSEVRALSLQTGAVAWTATVDTPIVHLAAEGDRLVVVSTRAPTKEDPSTPTAVRVLNTKDASLLWARHIEAATPVRPVVAGGLVAFSPAPLSIAGWELQTGVEVWRTALETAAAEITVAGSRLFVRGSSRGFYVVNAANGWVQWKLVRDEVIGRPGAEPDRLYLAFLDNTVIGYDLRGDRKWRSELAGRPLAGPSLAGDLVIVPLTSNVIVALEKASGTVRPAADKPASPPEQKLWSFSASDDGGMLFVALEGFGESRTLTALRRK